MVWVRVFNLYGPYDKPDLLMEALIQKMKAGDHISMTEGIQKWDYLFSSDAGRAFYLIGEKCSNSAIYCLGYGSSRPLREYVNMVADRIGYRQKIGYGEIHYTKSSVMNLCTDIESLTHDTEFMPLVDFKDGIEIIIKHSYGVNI